MRPPMSMLLSEVYCFVSCDHRQISFKLVDDPTFIASHISLLLIEFCQNHLHRHTHAQTKWHTQSTHIQTRTHAHARVQHCSVTSSCYWPWSTHQTWENNGLNFAQLWHTYFREKHYSRTAQQLNSPAHIAFSYAEDCRFYFLFPPWPNTVKLFPLAGLGVSLQ